jgi:glutathione S-transferase
MRSPIVMKLEAARVAKCYDALEARLSTPIENRDYMLTSGFSAADISVGQAVYMSRYFVTLDRHPAVSEWYDRITERASFGKSLPENGGIYEKDFYPPWPIE